MKFEKGMKAKELWEYLHYHILDECTGVEKGKILIKNVEIILKIDGKKVKDCWECKE